MLLLQGAGTVEESVLDRVLGEMTGMEGGGKAKKVHIKSDGKMYNWHNLAGLDDEGHTRKGYHAAYTLPSRALDADIPLPLRLF